MSKFKILMIEEDRFLRKIYRDKLTRNGFVFLEATNGVEGLNKVIAERPDLVILDIILPKKNGFEVLMEMKMNPDTKKIPVIILSNLGQATDIKRGLTLGAQAYLVKTDTTLSEVVQKVKECLLKTQI